jgi:glycosyltransferase involved in cell wall biosynthesis
LDDEVLAHARASGVLLLGERKDMPDLYAAADAVVLASWREGLPRVLMEGAAMGKPLIGTAVRGNREVIAGPEMGLLVPPRQPQALADARVTLAADESRRHAAGLHNRIEARRRFDLARSVARVVATYDELLAAHGR